MGRGIVAKNSSKNTSDLNENRHSEFLKEVQKSTTKSYFSRFQIKLRGQLGGININHAFTAKWKEIENAYYGALGPEQKVSRMSTFYSNDYSNFEQKPMERVIYEIDVHVDKTLGRSEETFTEDYSGIQLHTWC